jgi:hypothetical protein
MICLVLKFCDFAILGKMYYFRVKCDFPAKNANIEKFKKIGKKNVEVSTCKLSPKVIGSWTTFEFFFSELLWDDHHQW